MQDKLGIKTRHILLEKSTYWLEKSFWRSHLCISRGGENTSIYPSSFVKLYGSLQAPKRDEDAEICEPVWNSDTRQLTMAFL